MMKSVFILPVLTLLCACEAYKILVIFQLPGKSHSILGDGYVRHLIKAGHEVWYITPYPKKNVPPNLHQIDVSEVTSFRLESLTDINAVLNKEVDLADERKFFDLFFNITRMTLNNENVKKILDDPKQTFDVVVAEWMFMDIFAGFSAVFGAPLIWSSSVEPHPLILELMGEDVNTAYTPDIRSPSAPPYSFTERVHSLFTTSALKLLKLFYYTEEEKVIYDAVFGPYAAKRGRELPSYYEIRFNASLVLGNSHVSLGQATTVPQSYKGIGGYHIDDEVAPLPKDLQKLMDNAKDGVIFFSMGSTLRSDQFPNILKKNLLQMFGGLKQTVIWKFEEVMKDLPKNVHVLQWAPQQSILAHSNLILFITHGGLLSTTEATHFSVPIIGIPVFGDQFVNVARAAKKGFAKKVDLSYNISEDLAVAIDEILADPKYQDKAKELSFIYHHRPVSPGKELVHWIEHVVETQGALHLRTPAFYHSWYQKMYLDLAALVVLCFVAVCLILRTIFKRKSDLNKKNN